MRTSSMVDALVYRSSSGESTVLPPGSGLIGHGSMTPQRYARKAAAFTLCLVG
jgi:hypothetical protein